jgi:hypothetical protein
MYDIGIIYGNLKLYGRNKNPEFRMMDILYIQLFLENKNKYLVNTVDCIILANIESVK